VRRHLVNLITALSLGVCISLAIAWGWTRVICAVGFDYRHVGTQGVHAAGRYANATMCFDSLKVDDGRMVFEMRRGAIIRWWIADDELGWSVSGSLSGDAWNYGVRLHGIQDISGTGRHYDLLGFSVYQHTGAPPRPSTVLRISVPCSFLVVLSALQPLRWYRRKRADTRNRPVDQIFCVNCGYDLRATPDRCPECGVVPKKIQMFQPARVPQ
jgi:hypothetical protein